MINEERKKLKSEIIQAQKELLLQYERKPDKAHLDEYLNRLWGSRNSEADDDCALAELFSPCQKATSDEEIACVLQEPFKAWTGLVESCCKLTEEEEKYKDIPIPRQLAKTDLYPYCPFALIRELRHELSALWLSVKQHNCEHFDAIYLSRNNDNAILDIAERHENTAVVMALVSIVECRMELDNVYQVTQLIADKYRNDRMALANDFFNGTNEIILNYAVAKSLYEQALLPVARQRLKAIEKLISQQ